MTSVTGLSDRTNRSPDFRGPLAAATSFLIWGTVPIYWKQMHVISPFELIAHRVTWSLVFLLGIIAVQRGFGELGTTFRQPRTLANSALSGVLLATNWTVYVWAVNNDHVLESSLGYFLTPLGNVALGFLVLHERLRPLQWTAIGLAGLGVVGLLVGVGHVPWIALTLAGTWSCYAIARKRSTLGSMTGLTTETLLLLPFAAGLLLWRAHTGEGALGHVNLRLHVYVLSAGIVTAIPLLLFAYGARRIRLATLGLLQYIAPTVQFLIGLLVYHEPFDGTQLQAYVAIWCGLALYSADAFWVQRRVILQAAGAS
ncbi:MAG TPA: EamA family transporter RarD [Candidatus Didemnitutus sp.]|nr:EamA family transporter RarD [Candidatus Didemnitutus sp.]